MIGDSHFARASCVPVGRGLALLPITRRAFVGAGVFAPCLGLAEPAAAAGGVDEVPGLRFVEDAAGMTIVQPGAKPDPTIKKAEEVRDTSMTWRIERKSFGPAASFRLRTLVGGEARGYVLEAQAVSLGQLTGATHQFFFMWSSQGWKVRLLTSQWNAPNRAADPMVSRDILFEELCLDKTPALDPVAAVAQDADCIMPSRSFVFEVPGSRVADAIDSLCEGHLVARGTLRLALDTNCTWHLFALKGGSLRAANLGFGLVDVELAWCERDQGLADNSSEAPSVPASPVGRDRGASDPFFCAASKVLPQFEPLAMALASRLEITLTARHSPTWTYLRRNWRAPSNSTLPGILEMRSDWCVDVNARRPAQFGPIDVQQGVLRASRRVDGDLDVRFTAEIGPSPQQVNSRIGGLSVRGWPADAAPGSSATRRPPVALHLTCKPRRDADVAPAVVRAIDLTVLLLEADLVPADVEQARLTFHPTTMHAIFDSDAAAAGRAMDRTASCLWLGDVAALAGHSVARIDLTRARLELSKTHALASLAFAFSGLQLELAPGAAWIADRRNNCEVVEQDEPYPKAVDDAPVHDVRPTLVVEFPPQHMFEECIFQPGPPALPDVDMRDRQPTVQVTNDDAGPSSHLVGMTFPTNESALVAALQSFAAAEDRAAIRRACRRSKIAVEKQDVKDGRPAGLVTFEVFAAKFESEVKSKSVRRIRPANAESSTLEAPMSPSSPALAQSDWLQAAEVDIPTDQQVYVGPFALDPDVAAIARSVNRNLQRERLQAYIAKVVKEATALVLDLGNPATGPNPPAPPSNLTGRLKNLYAQAAAWMSSHRADAGLAGAQLEREKRSLAQLAVCATMPEYADFSDFYRSEMTSLHFDKAYLADNYGNGQLDIADVPATATEQDLEFHASESPTRVETKRSDAVIWRYARLMADPVHPSGSARARFAKPSRLAFRVDCTPRRTSSRRGPTPAAHASKAIARADSPGARFAYTFADLTDWSNFEMAVSPRSMQARRFDEGGMLVRGESSLSNGTPSAQAVASAASTASAVSDAGSATSGAATNSPATSGEASPDDAAATEGVAMMRMLGMRAGTARIAQDRLADVEASLRAPPTVLETAIEMPARLVLSPSQHAVWRTPRDHFDGPGGRSALTIPPCFTSFPIPLWTAELVPADPDPRLRAIHSPDLRPGFVRGGLERALVLRGAATDKGGYIHTPAIYAPPRGPRAPWTIGIEEADGATSAQSALRAATGMPDCPAASSPQGPATDQDLHPLIRYLCTRNGDMAGYQANAIFRASIDAYDRHELVLLTSAWGLPVRGRREQNGQLQGFDASSQVELPRQWQLMDVEAGTAAYHPRTLQLQELRLSALGGFLRHDSDFVPPSAARHLDYGPLFDSLSIERWQHWIVLGRDVHAEVVYKGYLFPIGHRASLVKQTERVFLRRAKGKRVSAYLRQRMFIRIGQPDKTFPAVGQPNGGRQFPTNLVRLLTLTSPDIVDPAQDTSPSASTSPTPAGRLFANEAGLVFWPRTARISGAEVVFEMQVEKATTRLPLIFVDNVAVNRPDLLGRLVAYYNRTLESPDVAADSQLAQADVDPAVHLRTLDLGGQAMRYCDELKPGASSHKTLYWTLKASGGVKSAPDKNKMLADNGWEGQNDRYDDPSLEGADQPPFYPALETVRIRVDQVERMTGNGRQIVLAQFDGHYIANGFAQGGTAGTPRAGKTGTVAAVAMAAAAAASAASQPADRPVTTATGADPSTNDAGTGYAGDSLDIYLDILNDVSLSMGASGDRSGAVFRPDTRLVALCRRRGPLGGAAQSDPAAPGKPGAPGKPTTLVDRYTQASDGSEASNQRAQAHARASYFPGDDCTILGVVKMKELAKLVIAKAAAEALPLLQDVVQYTVAGVEAGEEVVRTQVVLPLRDAVASIRQKWDSLDAQVSRESPDLGIALGDVFPDVDVALHDLEEVLGFAAGTTDPAEFVGALSQVYETGRRLVDAFGRAISNPLDRIQATLGARLAEAFKNLGNQIDALASGPAGLLGLSFPIDSGAACRALAQRLADRTLGFNDERGADGKQAPAPASAAASAPTSAPVPNPVITPEFALLIGISMPVLSSSGRLNQARSKLAGFAQDVRGQWASTIASAMCDVPRASLDTLMRKFFNAVVAAAGARIKDARESIDTVGERDPDVLAAIDILEQAAARFQNFKADAGSLANTLEYQAMSALPRLLDAVQCVQGCSSAGFPDQLKLLAAAAVDVVAVFAPDELPEVMDQLGQVDLVVRQLNQIAADMRRVQQRIASVRIDLAEPAKAVVRAGSAVSAPSPTPSPTGAGIVGALRDLAIVADNLKTASPGVPLSVADLAALAALRRQADSQVANLQNGARDWRRAMQVLPPEVTDLANFPFDVLIAAATQGEAVVATMVAAVDAVLDRQIVRPLRVLADDAQTQLLGAFRKVVTAEADAVIAIDTQMSNWAFAWGKIDAASAEAIKASAKANDARAENAKRVAASLESLDDLVAHLDELHPPLQFDPTNAANIAADDLVREFDKWLVKRVAPWRRTVLAAQSKLQKSLSATIADLLLHPDVGLVAIYTGLLDERNAGWKALNGTPAAPARDVLLVPAEPAAIYKPAQNPLPQPNVPTGSTDQLAWDLNSLAALGRDAKGGNLFSAPEALPYLRNFLQGWSAGSSTPLRIFQQVRGLSAEMLRGKLLDLIDFAAWRDEIESEIKMLVPSRISTSYDFEAELPSTAAQATQGIFVPKDGCNLKVHSTTSIDLLHNGATAFSCVGELGAFDIGLIGDAFKAATLHFGGVRFTSSGGPTTCDLTYLGFTIGEELKFIEELSPFFGSPKGNGFYLVPLATGFGIEAGYSLNLGTISLVDVAFFNISVNAAARLRFDNKPASFVVSLSRRDAPFTISAAPYGGSGFFELEADSHGIVGFEASFEYGGAGAFAYGPLSGQGRVMTGVYIRSSQHSTTIGASFFAGGSSSIWIFSFGASLSVTATPSGSQMIGDATYCFSFSLGLVDYDYSVGVRCTLQWSGGGSGTDADADAEGEEDDDEDQDGVGDGWDDPDEGTLRRARLLLAMAGHGEATSAEPGTRLPAKAGPKATAKRAAGEVVACRPERRVDTWCQADDWHAYRDYFAFDLHVETGEFQ